MKDQGPPLIFFATWAVLCVAVWSFYWKGTLAAKRRWHPRIIIGVGVVFLGFIAITMPPALVMAVPSVILISILNLKMTKFCGACAATLVQNPPWTKMRFCPKCGTSLQ